MSIPQLPNVTFDIFRGFDTAATNLDPDNPPIHPQWLVQKPAVEGAQGWMMQHMQAGRFGRNDKLFWTHLMYVDRNLDIRDPWNSLGTYSAANADTILVRDFPRTNMITPFMVVVIERFSRQLKDDSLRVYLDRCGPYDKLPEISAGVVPIVCGCPNMVLKKVLYADFRQASTGCACVNRGLTLITYSDATGDWRGTSTVCGTATTLRFQEDVLNCDFVASLDYCGSANMVPTSHKITCKVVDPDTSKVIVPFSADFAFQSFNSCCIGTFHVRITEDHP